MVIESEDLDDDDEQDLLLTTGAEVPRYNN